jgi:Fe-S cluster biogenesis protein NfuA
MSATADVAEEHPELVFARVQELQTQLEALPHDGVRVVADELVAAVVQMYGEGLARISAAIHAAGAPGEQVARALSADPVVATLLLIHDLHPRSLEERVQDALDAVRPYMQSHGGNVELLSLENGIARIHLRGSCSDCSASSATLELAIKHALEEAAPDLDGLEVEGIASQTSGAGGLPMVTGSASTGLELPMAPAAAPAQAPPAAWVDLAPTPEVPDGSLIGLAVGGRELVIANVGGTLLAYHDACASCGSPLRAGTLAEGVLTCPGCSSSFILPRAGRSLDDTRVQLGPVPLLRDGAHVRVALAA